MSAMATAPLGGSAAQTSRPDWLLDAKPYRAQVRVAPDGKEIALENGLVRRVFRLAPNAATVALDNLMTGEAVLRAVRPEARVEIDGKKYNIGGLTGQPVQNYLKPEWLGSMQSEAGALKYIRHETGKTRERFAWKKRPQWMPQDLPWPPPGVSLAMEYSGAAQGVSVTVHYELYDGVPLLCKWLTLRNASDKAVRLNSFASEILAAVEGESSVEKNPRWELPALHVETDYAFLSGHQKGAAPAVFWKTDPAYKTQVNYDLNTPCLLECHPPLGPDVEIAPGETFESFRTFELLFDSHDRERRSLAQRRFYRTIAPWVTENPIIMHVRSADPTAVRNAIDQCAEVGFELIILTFGSGFNFESRDAKYQAQIKELVDYAQAKNIVLGGYSLLASRGAATAADNTQGVPARYGVMPCLGSKWGHDYLAQLQSFMNSAGLGVLEHDGSYPGDACNATTHPFHRGLADSQWVQWRAITQFYQWCRANGVYLNIPDWYYLAGANKCFMGYRETNWSLPRAEQEIIERQNIFDGTWEKTPSMGWMFVPLTEYHGGGAAATIEPLKDHLPHYGQRFANLFGAGVQACYRGPRLYDSEETKQLVKKWVGFYKKHRAILDSDIIHLRRADGRALDYILHVNPALPEKALLMVYNPTNQAVQQELSVPLYYSGLTKSAKVREQDGKAKTYTLARDYAVQLPVNVPANGTTWFIFE